MALPREATIEGEKDQILSPLLALRAVIQALRADVCWNGGW
jgi:hypothetical protein